MRWLAVLQSLTVYSVQMYRACIWRFSVFTSHYAHMYCVPRYTSQPRPSQSPQSRGSNLEPIDGHHTIPSNGETPS